MHDPFVGTWELNRSESQDPNHRPSSARMRWRLELDGAYSMFADGQTESGEHCVEKPQRFATDGCPYPVENLPGWVASRDRPGPARYAPR